MENFSIELTAGLLCWALGVILVVIWIYKDAKARNTNPFLWILLTILISPNFLGLIIYFLVRPKERQIVCENCGASVSVNAAFCSKCGNALKNSDLSPLKTPSNKLIFSGIGAMILSIICVCVFITGHSANINYGIIQSNFGNHWNAQFKQMNGRESADFQAKTDSAILRYSSQITEGEIVFTLYNSNDSIIAQIPVNQSDTLRNFTKGKKYVIKANARKAKGKFSFEMK